MKLTYKDIKRFLDEEREFRFWRTTYGGAYVRTFMEKRGFSIRGLARHLGYSPAYICRGLNKKLTFSAGVILRVAGLLSGERKA